MEKFRNKKIHRDNLVMKKWILILIMGLSKGQVPGSDMDARFLTDEEREERQENPPDGLGTVFECNFVFYLV